MADQGAASRPPGGPDDAGGEPAPVRWTRIATVALVTFPVLGALVVVPLATATLEAPGSYIVAALVALPAVAALLVRSRVIWLVAALPALRDELREIAQAGDTGEDGDVAPQAAELAEAADEVDARLRDRLTLAGVWRLVRWVRAPVARAGELAGHHLGPRAAATVATTAGVAERLTGLLLLVGIALWGTALQVVVAIVLVVAALLA